MRLEYIAGLFDGEGFFQIDKSHRADTTRGYAYQCHARITMRDKKVLKNLHGLFSGSFRQASPPTTKRAAYWSWDVCGENAKTFAEVMYPLLLIKKKQAKLIYAFQSYKAENKNQPCSDERWNKYEEFYLKMKKLNQKGPNHIC